LEMMSPVILRSDASTDLPTLLPGLDGLDIWQFLIEPACASKFLVLIEDEGAARVKPVVRPMLGFPPKRCLKP
jgi:hypothetical protein